MNRDLDLMRLHDAELSEEEAAELERDLDESELRVLAGLEDLGERIRLANAHASVDLTDSILARLDEIDREPANVAPTVRELRPRANTTPWIAGGLALAAAAAVAVWFTSRHRELPPPVARKPVPVVAPSAVPTPTHEETVAELMPEEEEVSAPAASIEAIDFGNKNGTIFMVPSGDETTPVVWLADDPSSRTEPL